jgi:hypothetical protein
MGGGWFVRRLARGECGGWFVRRVVRGECESGESMALSKHRVRVPGNAKTKLVFQRWIALSNI